MRPVDVFRVRGSTGGGGGATDPYWANVASLLHFDGADASTTFTDQTGKTWTRFGNAQIDTAQSKFGGSSLLLDGSGDSASTANHAEFNFGSGDFTLEAWCRLNTIPGASIYPCIVNRRQGFSTGFAFDLVVQEGGTGFTFEASSSGTSANKTVAATHALATGVWYHVAVSRSGNNLRIFVNGVLEATTDVTGFSIHSPDTPLSLGRLTNDGSVSQHAFNGWIDEFRITKGVARYTANFTPPTSAFPNS